MQEIYKAHKWTEIPISREQLDQAKQKMIESLKKESNNYQSDLNSIENIRFNNYVSEVVQGESPKIWQYMTASTNTEEGIYTSKMLTEISFNCESYNDDNIIVGYYLISVGDKSTITVTKGVNLTKPSYVNIDVFGKGLEPDNYRVYMSQQDINKAKNYQENGFDYKKYACMSNY